MAQPDPQGVYVQDAPQDAAQPNQLLPQPDFQAMAAGFDQVTDSMKQMSTGVATVAANAQLMQNIPAINLAAQMATIAGDIAELKEMHRDLVNTVSQLRTELKADISELRTELKADIKELRTELKADIDELRTEMKAVSTNSALR